MDVLQSLHEAGACRVSDLADRLRLAQSTISALVAKLVAAGLVARNAETGDRRASILTLTPTGRSDVARWDAAHRRRIEHALRALAPDDRDVVFAAVVALSKLVEILERHP